MTFDLEKQIFTPKRGYPVLKIDHYENYSNILKISPPKTKSFQIKLLIFFIFLLNTSVVGTR